MIRIVQVAKKYSHDPVFRVVSFIRIIVGVSIIVSPVPAWIVSAILDIVDGQVFIYHCGLSSKEYHVWDKFLDVAYLLPMLVVAWRNQWVPLLATGLFIFRFLGQLLFWSTQEDRILLLFPNVFETVWLWSAARALWFSGSGLLSWPGLGWLVVLLTVKIGQEWGLHFFGQRGLFKWSRSLLRPIMPWLRK